MAMGKVTVTMMIVMEIEKNLKSSKACIQSQAEAVNKES